MKLTNHEIMLIVVVAIALLGGAIVKHYRNAHPPANPLPVGIRGR